jgi:adenylate kinase family enzyme
MRTKLADKTKNGPLMPDTLLSKHTPLLNKIFFLEDTSVRIHTLSTESVDFPGTEIKFWMKEHDFKSVDLLLREHGNDRRVTVRSDILLYLPKHLRKSVDQNYKQFTGMESGNITEKEHVFSTNELYPWLDNQSFNKWFVPSGCNLPISMLPEPEATKHDFRARAFSSMLNFLEEENIIKKKPYKPKKAKQEVLFSDTHAFLVCGLPCAGKTTLGEFLGDKYAYYHIEASDFMHLSYHETHGTNSAVRISDFAEKVLLETPSIVVDQTLAHLAEMKDPPFIITGFRSPKELENFESKYSGLNTIHKLYITANAALRYKRNLLRMREGDIADRKEFLDRDKQQLRMGLEEIERKLKSKVIPNNADFADYYKAFLSRYPLANRVTDMSLPPAPEERPPELEEAILIALLNENCYLTTTEIAHHVNSRFPNSKVQTNKNNVSRYFNQKFHPYYETNKADNKLKYHLSPTGRSRAIFVLKRLYNSR